MHRRAAALICLHLMLIAHLCPAEATTPQSPVPAPHDTAAPTMLDVVADGEIKALHTRRLLTDLKKEDFRLFDNGRQVPISSFQTGMSRNADPIDLWFIVLCNSEYRKEWGSGFVRGNVDLFKPAFQHLDTADAVGAAHWCDDGTGGIDVPPSSDGPKALAAVNTVLHGPFLNGVSRRGEAALQQMFQTVLDFEAKRSGRLPVFLFLYGDHSATYPLEAEPILVHLLKGPAMVFGIDQDASGMELRTGVGATGQISHLIHFFSNQTGGQYYGVSDVSRFPTALDYILAQVHFRYVLGFRPAVLDGQRHPLRLELTPDAKKRYGAAELRYRPEYIPATQSQ